MPPRRFAPLRLGRSHDRPIDRAAHLVDVHGLVGVHALRPRFGKLDLWAVAQALLQIVTEFPYACSDRTCAGTSSCS